MTRVNVTQAQSRADLYNAMQPMSHDALERKALYAAVWRWHFYAGLYVAPFLILLAITGLVMLAKDPIDRWQLGPLAANTAGSRHVSH